MVKLLKRRLEKKDRKKDKKFGIKGDTDHLKPFRLSEIVEDNITRLKNSMNNTFDIKSREFQIGGTKYQVAILYIADLVNEEMIMSHLLKPLILQSTAVIDSDTEVNFQSVKDSMLSIGSVQEAETFDEIVLAVMSGDTFLCIQGYAKGLIVNTRELNGKPFAVPTVEPSVKGPQEAFVETLKINLGLIRKRIRDPNLMLEEYKIGRRSKSESVLVYIKGIADPDIVEDLRKRLSSVDLDMGQSAFQIGTLVTDRPDSIFPQVQITERPDKLVVSLSEGRVAVLTDGSPNAILVPVTLPILMQSPDDYCESWLVSSLIRISRYVGLFLSSLFPAIYIAITSYNPGMLPTRLVLSIASTRTGVPFSAFIEALLMEAVLELLQEASIRLPKAVGQTVSIVGGLVIGQSAVQAGIVSPIMVIVISVTAVTSFAIPDYSLGLASRILRVPFMILATTLGSFGIAIGMLLLLTYLSSLKNFGIRYLSPITPYRFQDWKDTVIRAPFKDLKKRPEFLNPEDTERSHSRKKEKEIS